MKRRIWFVTAILAVTTMFVACGKKNDDGINATVATNGAVLNNNLLRSNCLNQPYVVNNQLMQTATNCGFANLQNNAYFSQYPVNNGYYQGYSNGFVDGFTACPQGTFPTYSPGIGLSCLQNTFFTQIGVNPTSYMFPTWQWNSVSFNFDFYGNYGHNHRFKGHHNNYVRMSCRRGTNACGGGYNCLAAPGSAIGICHGQGRRGGGWGHQRPHRNERPGRGGHHRGGGRRH